LKFIRIVLFYALFFMVALIVAAIFFKPGNEGFLLLFSFIAPGIMVWLYEKRRARRLEAKTSVQPETQSTADNQTTIQQRSAAATATAQASRSLNQPRISGTGESLLAL